jgi:hypothetical protein
MKNTQGQEYRFSFLGNNTWLLIGEPQLTSVVKDGQMITRDADNVDLVNYSGNLTLSRGMFINQLQIQQINYINGIPQYVTQ